MYDYAGCMSLFVALVFACRLLVCLFLFASVRVYAFVAIEVVLKASRHTFQLLLEA